MKIELNWTNSYANMRPIIDKNPEVTDILKTAFNKSNTELIFVPIRGGTDGATFSFLGVPCPNIGVGGYNCHGKYSRINSINSSFVPIKEISSSS